MIWYEALLFQWFGFRNLSFFTVQLEPVNTPNLHITDDQTQCVFKGFLKGYLVQDFKDKKI